MDTDERWRVIPGWRAYEISDHGRCRSVGRLVAGKLDGDGRRSSRWIPGKLLTPVIRPSGMPCYNLWRGNDYEQHPARRLVLMAFHSPRPRGMDAVNKNGDVRNVHLSNLKWAHSERARNQSVRELMGMR